MTYITCQAVPQCGERPELALSILDDTRGPAQIAEINHRSRDRARDGPRRSQKPLSEIAQIHGDPALPGPSPRACDSIACRNVRRSATKREFGALIRAGVASSAYGEVYTVRKNSAGIACRPPQCRGPAKRAERAESRKDQIKGLSDEDAVRVNKWQKRQKVPAVAQLPEAGLHPIAEIAEIAPISKTSTAWASSSAPRGVAQIAQIAQIPYREQGAGP